MNKYIKPEVEINELEFVDVVQTSGLKEGGEGGGNGTIVIPNPESEAQTLSLWEK